MTPTRRTAALALLALLALMALPLASAQQGPPPGYTDPTVYAQDYVAEQAGRAQADPAGYAGSKATPENATAEAEHAAWLACWTAYEAGQMALDPVCAQFFTAPGTVDAPAEAEAGITETLNGTDALLDETLDAVGDTLDDPTTAVEQVQRIVEAVVGFVRGIVGPVVDGVVGLAQSLVDRVLDLVGLGRTTTTSGLGALGDGLLVLLGLPALGIQTSVDGLTMAAGATADGVAAASAGFADAMVAAGDALVGAVVATADGIATGGQGLGDGVSALGSAVADAGAATRDAVGDAGDAVADAVEDAAQAVTETVAGWFGGEPQAAESDGGLVGDGALETGTEADGLVDRILGLL